MDDAQYERIRQAWEAGELATQLMEERGYPLPTALVRASQLVPGLLAFAAAWDADPAARMVSTRVRSE